MTEQRFIKIVLLLSLTLVVFLAGCGGGNTPSGESTPPPESQQEQPANTAAADPENITAFLARGEGSGFTYESVASGYEPGTTVISKHWVQGKNAKTESADPAGSGTMVSIIQGDKGVMYTYHPDENMAFKMNIGYEDATDGDYDVDRMKYIGRDTVDGKPCLVYEVIEEEDAGTVKVWFWEAYGFPLRTVIEDEGITITVENRNVTVGNIPASAFELPAGVEVMEF